jgi:ketosteroid isomerase-like protein
VKRSQPDLRCWFCHKSQDVVEKLISSPSEPRAYICDECVAVCDSILANDEIPVARRLAALETVGAFVAAINRHDASRIAALMTDDHVIVDSLGYRVRGAAATEAGSYFAVCPDYWIRTDSMAVAGDVVLAVGEAGGTIDGVAWRTPAAWKAVIREGKVAEWRVYADSKPVSEILERRG